LEIYVLIPLSTPGSGKTFFYENILEPYFKTQEHLQLKLLSSDVVNLKLIQDYQKKHPLADNTKAYDKTRSIYKEAYEDEIRNIFSTIYEDTLNNPPKNNVKKIVFIYIDKNHPLNYGSQNLVHAKLKKFSNFDDLKFISLTLLSREFDLETDSFVQYTRNEE
jgi:hypothetical protein